MPIKTVDGVDIEITQEELEALSYVSPEALGKAVRHERNALLAETDWWALADRTMTQAEIDYRQALRDITDQAGYPTDITWPTKPE